MNESTGINVPLLRKGLEYVTEHPEEHDQGAWIRRTPCGTVGCLAYHVLAIAGREFRWLNGTPYVVSLRDMEHVSVREAAIQELGLSELEAVVVFSSRNSIKDLWVMAEYYTNGEITRPVNQGGV